jgi:signal transduction histidine kinase
VAVQLQKASAFLDRDRAAAEQALADAERSARNALGEVRRSVAGLREDATPFRLSAALAELARHAQDDALRVRVEVAGDDGQYDLATLTALYRAAQEGLTNARRHGHASQVSLSATFDEFVARLVVADDGRGFAPTTAGFGLRGMRERVALLGGDVDIDSTPGTPTTITVTIPGSA